MTDKQMCSKLFPRRLFVELFSTVWIQIFFTQIILPRLSSGNHKVPRGSPGAQNGIVKSKKFGKFLGIPKNHLNFGVFCQYNGQVPRKFPAFLEKLAKFFRVDYPIFAKIHFLQKVKWHYALERNGIFVKITM